MIKFVNACVLWLTCASSSRAATWSQVASFERSMSVRLNSSTCIRATWLIYTCGTWLIHMCDMTHWWKPWACASIPPPHTHTPQFLHLQMNASCESCHTYEWVLWHSCISHVTRMSGCVCVYVCVFVCVYVCVWMCACVYEWVLLHVWMSDVTFFVKWGIFWTVHEHKSYVTFLENACE